MYIKPLKNMHGHSGEQQQGATMCVCYNVPMKNQFRGIASRHKKSVHWISYISFIVLIFVALPLILCFFVPTFEAAATLKIAWSIFCIIVILWLAARWIYDISRFFKSNKDERTTDRIIKDGVMLLLGVVVMLGYLI
jgi:hypothetical protein